jgi:subtilase family serine protease
VLLRAGGATRNGGSGPSTGFTPAQLQAAYNLPSSTKGAGQIVAIVDAYDNPNVTSDLAQYRSTFGLPAANFTKYNQEGQTKNYPEGNPDWGLEIDLDVQMVSASCPNCIIYLLEANSNSISDLEAAEVEAVTLGAHIVSNSYDGTGASQSYYDTPGVTYLASAGDLGYGIEDPADFETVAAIGGTTLTEGGHGKRGWTETVWDGSGAGCSEQTKPPWQHDPGCSFRTANDVSAVADPNTGVAVYDTFAYDHRTNGWLVVGGTSVSSPLLAGVFGLAGNATSQDGGRNFWRLKERARDEYLFEVTSGSDGYCSPTYLCTAGTHEYKNYSGPAGWGTPNGIGAF